MITIIGQPDYAGQPVGDGKRLNLPGAVVELQCECGHVNRLDCGETDQYIEYPDGTGEHTFGVYCEACDAEIEEAVRYRVTVTLERKG